MDVGAPSNWVRIMDMFNNNKAALQKVMKGYRFTDDETLEGIKAIYNEFNCIACPHTAIAWLALQQYRMETADHNFSGVFLSTAHACKFPDVFPAEMMAQIEIPEQVKNLSLKPKHATAMDTNF